MAWPEILSAWANHGRTGGSWVWQPLPRRVPGAALVDNPAPVDPPVHVCRFRPRKQSLRQRVADAIDCWWRRWPLEARERFESWWHTTETSQAKRQYHGRHRYDELSATMEWRRRWARYVTSEWPTFATAANASDLVTSPQLTEHEWQRVIEFAQVT